MNNKEATPGVPDRASARPHSSKWTALTGRRESSGQKPTLAQRLTRAASAAAVLGTMTFGSGVFKAETVNAQGVPNQEDGITLLTGDIPQEAPILDTTEVDLAGLQADPQALRYIAGGEFMNPNGLGDRFFKLGGNPTVLLSQEAREAVSFELLSQGVEPTPDLAANYAMGKWGSQLNAANGATMAAIDGTNVFAFQNDGKVTQLTEGQPPLQVKFGTSSPFQPKMQYHEGIGLVGTDGFNKIINRFDPAMKQWQDVGDYITLGTADQRMKKRVESLMSEQYSIDGNIVQNPLGLNKAEADHYIKTGSDKGLSSFQVLSNPKGEPVMLVATEGQYGFSKNDFQKIKDAFARIYQIDPTFFNKKEFALTREVAPGTTFQTYPNYSATYHMQSEIVQLNTSSLGPNASVATYIFLIMTEEAGMHFEMSSQPLSNIGLSKNELFEAWISQNVNKLTQAERDRFATVVNVAKKNYM